MNQPAAPAPPRYARAFMLVTSLFFMWGLAYGLLDVLNKHFQETLNVSRARSALLQAAYFGAYFIIAIPAARFMRRFGYKRGILAGLGLYIAGALLFVPATAAHDFSVFLLALFVLASGLGCLETAANPYVTLLGSPASSEQRLNLSQSFNGLGAFIGPLIGGKLFFTATSGGASANVQGTYVAIAAVVCLLALAFLVTPMPEHMDQAVAGTPGDSRPHATLLRQPHFVGAVIAQFFYVAAQVGVNAFFINYVTEHQPGASSGAAAYLLSLAMIAFVAGRFLSTALMSRFAPGRLLLVYALVNIALCLVVVAAIPGVSVIALVAVSFFMSIMFPTIFALGVKQLGPATKQGSSLIIMSIVGGAILPFFMGLIADHASTAIAYLLPAGCFAIVAWYGARGHRIH